MIKDHRDTCRHVPEFLLTKQLGAAKNNHLMKLMNAKHPVHTVRKKRFPNYCMSDLNTG